MEIWEIKALINKTISMREIDNFIVNNGTLKLKSGSTYFIEPMNQNLTAITATVIDNKIMRYSITLRNKLCLSDILLEFPDLINVKFNRIDEEVNLNFKFSNCDLNFILPGNYHIKENNIYNCINKIPYSDIFIDLINISLS